MYDISTFKEKEFDELQHQLIQRISKDKNLDNDIKTVVLEMIASYRNTEFESFKNKIMGSLESDDS